MNPIPRKNKSQRKKHPVLGSILLVVGLAIPLYNWKWVFAAQIGEIENPEKLPSAWVSFAADKPLDTGLGLLEEGTRKPVSRYVLVPLRAWNIPGRLNWLVVEAPVKQKDGRLTGCLMTWSTPLRKKALDRIRLKFPHDTLMPFQMDATYDFRGQCWAMLAMAGIVVVIGLWILLLGFAPLRKLAKGSSTVGPPPTWLHELGGNAPAPQETGPCVQHVFEARQINALSADRLYRVYVEDRRCYLIRIGGQNVSPEVPSMFSTYFGLVGGIVGGLVWALGRGGKKSPGEIAKLDAQHPSDLLGSHEHNFCFTASDVFESSLDPPSVMFSHGAHAGRWRLMLKDGKKRTFQFESMEDMHAAVRTLTSLLGTMIRVNVTWDETNERYRKQ